MDRSLSRLVAVRGTPRRPRRPVNREILSSGRVRRGLSDGGKQWAHTRAETCRAWTCAHLVIPPGDHDSSSARTGGHLTCTSRPARAHARSARQEDLFIQARPTFQSLWRGPGQRRPCSSADPTASRHNLLPGKRHSSATSRSRLRPEGSCGARSPQQAAGLTARRGRCA